MPRQARQTGTELVEVHVQDDIAICHAELVSASLFLIRVIRGKKVFSCEDNDENEQ
jgi:hypothetical protein